MITKNLIDLVFGYVQFSAKNGFPERFINLCTARNIPLWDIHKSGESIIARTSVSGYRHLRQSARQSSMNTRIIKKAGLPFLINKYTKRTGMIAGFILMVIALIFLSGRVWLVEVSGNETLTDREIIEAFEDAGLQIGKKINKLERSAIENGAMLLLNDISWASYNVNGCSVELTVRERKHVPDIETHSGKANIIASKDGQIVLLEAYRGTACVKIGEAVTKGTLLVSGITESRVQTNLFTDADAYVVAQTEINVQTRTPKKVTEYIPKTKKIWSIYFLGKEFLPPGERDGDCYTHRSRLTINGKTLPFGINYRIYTTYEKKEKTVSKAEAELTAINEYAIESYNKTKHAQVLSSDVTMEHTDDAVIIRGKYTCYENIGEVSLFEVEETYDTEYLPE
jgi:similar to stage IV sporulation protein